MSAFLSSMCRLCGNISEELLKLYNEEGNSDYAERIHNYLNIELEVGESWLWIGWCEACKDKLVQWDEFANKVKIVDSFFTSLHDSIDIVVDSDSNHHGVHKEPEESLRLTNRKKKRRKKSKDEPTGSDGDTADLQVYTSGAISSSDISSNEKIRLTIKKIKDGQFHEESTSETDQNVEEDTEVAADAVEQEEADNTGKLKQTSSPNCSPVDVVIEDVPQANPGQSTDLTQFRWECWFCKTVQTTWSALVRHCKLVHESTARIECLCGQVLFSRSSVVKHHLKHTVGLKYKCDFEKCSKTFVRQSLLDAHTLSHLPKDMQPWLCCKCSRRFHSESLLKQHEKMHLPKDQKIMFPCYICQKKLCSKSAVTAHIRSVHLRERPFVCDQCGLSFTSKGILAEHLMVHSDVFNHHCQDCGKCFKTKYRLRIHMDTHLQTRYSCPICDLSLNTRRTLRMHLLVHQDRRSFSCDTCGKSFKRSKDLKNHRNLHTGNRPYFCPFCPRTFANGSNCRSHKRRMHPVQLKQLEDGILVKDTTMLDLQDVTEEEQAILQGDVLMVEPIIDVAGEDELELDKNVEDESMEVISSEELAANFTVLPFQSSFMQSISQDSLYRQ